MPLGTLERLPRGRRIWETVYSEGLASHGDEQRAARTAWSAVKGAGYYQDAEGVWRSPRGKGRNAMSKKSTRSNGRNGSMREGSAAARRRGEIDAATLLKRLKKLPAGYTFSVKAKRTIGGRPAREVPVRIRKAPMGNVIAVGDTAGSWYAETLLQRGEVPRALLIDGGSDEGWTNPREVFAAFMLDESAGRSSGKSAGRKKTPVRKPKAEYKVGQFIRINKDTTAEILAVRPHKRPGGGGFMYTIKQSNVAEPLEFDQNTLGGFEVIRKPRTRKAATKPPARKPKASAKVTAAQRKVLERAIEQMEWSRKDSRVDPTIVAPSGKARTFNALTKRGLLERPMAMSPVYAITAAGAAAIGKQLPKPGTTPPAKVQPAAMTKMELSILVDLLEDEAEAEEEGIEAVRDFYLGEADFKSAYKLLNRGYATAVRETPEHLALAITGKGMKAANDALAAGDVKTPWMGQRVSDRAWVPISETEASIVYGSEARADEKRGDYLEIVKLADSKASASLAEKRRLIGVGQYEPKWRWYSGRVGNPAPRAPRCAPRGKLSARMRKSLPSAAFALPTQRKYPLYKVAGRNLVPSGSHAANAKSRAKQALNRGTLTRRDYNRVVRAANRVLAMCGGQ